MTIRIVTDTNVNLPVEVIERYRIELVPAIIIFDGETYKEGVEISTAEVIARLEAGFEFPKTSQPPPHDVEVVYRSILAEEPAATILSLHLTGAQSGTVRSAEEAARVVRQQFPEATIHVYDTQAFSIAQGLMVLQAAVMADGNEPIESILHKLDDMAAKVQLFFILDSLDYVHRGGRLGRAAHLVGSLLKIKAVLTFKDGELAPFATFRTMKKAMQKMVELASEAAEKVHSIQVAVGYAIHQTDAATLAGLVKDSLNTDVLLFHEIGPALAVYAGPGAIGIAWYPAAEGG